MKPYYEQLHIIRKQYAEAILKDDKIEAEIVKVKLERLDAYIKDIDRKWRNQNHNCLGGNYKPVTLYYIELAKTYWHIIVIDFASYLRVPKMLNWLSKKLNK